MGRAADTGQERCSSHRAGRGTQFARYLPAAAARSKKLILICREDLAPLFATVPGIAEIRQAGEIAVAEFDVFLPLLSMPLVFGTTLDSVPAEVPYIDAAAIARRKQNPALALAAAPGPRVGIVWAGSPTNRTDPHRSCPLSEFLPVLKTPGAVFYSLQKGEQRAAGLPPEIQVHDLDPLLGDFGDLAVIVDQLDLVISIDTSVAHVAGAREAGLDAPQRRGHRLALGFDRRDHAVVSDDAAFSPGCPRRLARRHGAGGGGLETQGMAAARKSGCSAANRQGEVK
jgi:hypothetical protein